METLENVSKHAYAENEKGHAGVYIRYREGLNIGYSNEKSKDYREILKKTLRKEEENNPRLLQEFIEDRPGGVEIFVIDSGVGLCKTLEGTLKNNYNKKIGNPFPEACKLVFIEGARRGDKKQVNRTKSGGLYFIGQSLTANKDFIYGRDHNSWIGTYFPFEDPKETQIHKLDYSDAHARKRVLGLAWLARLSWIQETEKIKKYLYSWEGNASDHPVYQELKKERIDLERIQNIYFEDYRFEKDQKLYVDYKSPSASDNYFFILPSERHSKAAVWKLIDSYVEKIPKNENLTLIVADINVYDIGTYLNALHGSQFQDYKRTFVKKISKIILITKRMAVSVLKRVIHNKKEYTYEYDINATTEFYKNNSNNFFEPDKKLKDVFLWLRRHDSILFWETINRNENKHQILIRGDIKWDDEITLSEYLNFVQTLPIFVCLKLFRIAMERSSGFFPERECKFKNMDFLTKRLCSDLNSNMFPYYEGKNTVNIGSVLVSGYTQKEIIYDKKTKRQTVDIHFFKNSASANDICHLLLWPKTEWIENNFKKKREGYERVGKTHVIAKGGNKFFIIPRYNKGIPAYKRTPIQTYADVQKEIPRFSKIGHAEYENFHDLIILNHIDIVGSSFKTRSSLAIFLLSEFFFALGGNGPDDLSDLGKSWWEILNEATPSEPPQEEVALIVYLSHTFTDFIIEEIKNYFSPQLNQKIYAFIPIKNRRDGSSLLISPLVFEPIIERINKHKKEGKKAGVILFDDAIISGRTRKEIKHILFHLGANEVKTISIVDRQRLPFNSPDISRHSAYWRIDLPRLGNKSTCPLCKALKIATNFKNELLSDLAKKRINEWSSGWKKISPLAISPEHGISPSLVNLRNPKKKFGEKDCVNIKNSIGLTLYTTELHAMTSTNNLALRYCKSEKTLSAAAKIELLASQLLLFGSEFSKTMHQELLIILFNSANQLDEVDNHTSLASLVLLVQDDFYIKALMNYLIDEEKFTEEHIGNIDISIILAYYTSHNESLRMRFHPQKISRLLKGNADIRLLYNQFHSEIYDLHGRIHSKPLPLLVEDNATVKLKSEQIDDNKTAVMSFALNRLEDALNSISMLTHILKNIPDSYFLKRHKENTLKELKVVILKDLKSKYDLISHKIKDIKKADSHSAITTIFQELEPKLNETLESLKGMHSLLFLKVGKAQTNKDQKLPITAEIEKIITSLKDWVAESRPINHKISINKKKQIFPDNTSKEIWFCWDKNLYNELKYLISNVRHGKGKIRNPWDVDGYFTGEADMWIDFHFSDKYLEVVLANKSIISSIEINQLVEKNKRWEQEYIINLGGKLEYSDKKIGDYYIIYTHFIIPYML